MKQYSILFSTFAYSFALYLSLTRKKSKQSQIQTVDKLSGTFMAISEKITKIKSF